MGKAHRWQDEEGFIHACASGFAGVDGKSPKLVWTECDIDVPAGESYMTEDDAVTCNSCVRWLEND